MSSLLWERVYYTTELFLPYAAVALVAMGWSLWWWRTKLVIKKPFSNLPMPPNSHPLLGHIKIFKNQPFQEAFQRIMLDHCDAKGRTGFWLGPIPCVSCTHWQDAKAIFHSVYERENLPFHANHVNMLAGPKQIGFLMGKEWRFHRGALVRSLKPQNMQTSVTIMTRVVHTMVTSLQAKIATTKDTSSITMNVHELLKMITIDSFGQSAFSTDFGCCQHLELTQFCKAFDYLLYDFSIRIKEPLFIPWNYFYSIPTRRNRQLIATRHIVRSFLDEMIQLRRARPTGDILSNVIQAHNETKHDNDKDEDCSDETLKDIFMSMLLAGYDTTSIALSYALYLIARHPDVEALCLEEIAFVQQQERSSSSSATTTSPVDPSRYVYCQAVFTEAMRLYPPFPQIMRNLQRSLTVDKDLTLPKGTMIIIPIFSIQRSERAFPRPLEFRPDRWVKPAVAVDAAAASTGQWVARTAADVDSSDIAPGNPEACFFFSAGARSCPGMRFAVQLGTLALAGLLSQLKFAVPPDAKDSDIVPVRSGPMQVPRGGVHLAISTRRTTNTPTPPN